MRKHYSGFTIVELMIVIVVIGILASVTLVAFNGAQVRARNSTRVAQANHITKLMEIYKVDFGTYPKVAPGNYCVGTGYPNGNCREYTDNDPWWTYPESNMALTNELAKVGPVPKGDYFPAGSVVGPYVHVYSDHYSMQMPMEIEDGKDCPKGMTMTWNNPDNNEALCMSDFYY